MAARSSRGGLWAGGPVPWVAADGGRQLVTDPLRWCGGHLMQGAVQGHLESGGFGPQEIGSVTTRATADDDGQ
ncbi:hypothetical protein GCM10020000_82160 [Streptomyces olivoverticillatus]